MATAIYFNGRRINIPQAATKIDASALASVSPSAVGIVALVGTAEGGKPLTVDETFSDHSNPASVIDTYRSGDLRTAGQLAFNPSADDAVPGGAQKVVAVKVNPATQSTATLPDAAGVDSVDLTSSDYGQFTEQINISVAAGTTAGKKLSIVFEDTTEVIDNVGGTSIFTALYTPGAAGYSACTGEISSTAFTAAAVKGPDAGLTTQRSADIPAPGVFNVASSNAGDTTQAVTLFGLNAANLAISETVLLNGTTAVQGTTSFYKVLGASLSAAAAGTVTISDFPVTTTLFALAPATVIRGLLLTTNTPVEGVCTVAIDVDTAVDVVVRGLSSAGADIAERFDMTAGATTPVVGTVQFSKITQIELGDVAAARSIVINCNAARTLHSVFPTVQKVVDRLNSADGFTAAATVSNPTTFLMTDADYAPSLTLIGSAAGFFADLFAVVTAINGSSNLMTAARNASGVAVPANTVGPVFLSGGVEGTPTITEWTAAINLLKKRRVNIIVPLSRDPAVHSVLLSHLVYRAGAGRSEANGYVGIGTAGGAGETLANIKTQIQALSTRHISAISQEFQRNDFDTGLATFYPPYMLAAEAAGMQAGSAIGEPLTRKRPIALDLRNDASWSVEDDASELIDAGAMIAEKVDGLGIRWVRSITTHLADDNVVFTEMSANEAANFCVFELRNALETKVGQRGLAGSAAALKGLANAVLSRLVDDEIIVAYRSLQVDQVGDVFPVSVEVAPVLPINFIPITVHLVAVKIAA
ncbi:hypothetical protein K0U83_16985 [bacterium]|nr:hypothetical protein [bacterium]